MSERIVHRPTLRAGVRLFALFLLVAVVLGLHLPEQYPAHFNAAGQPTRYAEGPGMWILLVTFCVIAFGQGYLFQRYLVTIPPAPYLNVPYKKLFHRLPVDRQIPVLRRANRLLVLRGMIKRKLREEGLLPGAEDRARAG